MRVSFDAADLRRHWSVICGVLPARTTMPVYQNIKVDTVAESVMLTGTDCEMQVESAITGNVRDPGAVLLPGQHTLAILREAVGEVTIESRRNTATITTDAGEFELPTEDASGFVGLQNKDAGEYSSAKMESVSLLSLLSSVSFAAAVDEGKYAMRGVFVGHGGEMFDAVASDGKRLAVASVNVTMDNGNRSGLLPQKAVALACKMLADSGEAWLRIGANSAVISSGCWSVTTRLVEGRFPPYRDVIPKSSKSRVPIVADEFARLVRSAAVMADEESKRVEIEIARDGSTSIRAQGATRGKSAVRGKLGEVSGDAVKIAFDPKYLLEGMKAVGGREVEGHFIDGGKPAVFRCGDVPGLNSWLYLVVPLT